MRVIAGSAGGLRLKIAPGGETRPVGDRAKEALFNIIGPGLPDSDFLDLFAGTGSVGIEALSRSAASAVFVEISPATVGTIHENLAHTRLESQAVVVQSDVYGYLRKATERSFDTIYVAPPQYREMWSKTIRKLDSSIEWVNPDGIVIAQIDPKEYSNLDLKHLDEYDRRKYGRTEFVFYERKSE